VIKRAKAVLKTLEEEKGAPHRRRSMPVVETGQISLTDIGSNEIAETLKGTDLNTLTPLEALSLLYELKKKL
jgi:DNA mismatch repair protein MutS